ncbi:thiol:disulfide interchange protein DsbA/DsbL [Sideroxydans lithotrophicus]|uniref:Thiol:disulfide interchange protein n=1 Tax=Sideroxydans lithotrophicus (strain ES-1) TaxID=580332 RepID=D5CU35_SIDLE|nr:thiol:disulfide interchange protein DsbA/DsbL [Sideroxydans lithotrophicus]ADE10370.1 DSBA oxidoreductase [Sideroxydans lithotrophicus ES-1]
MRFLKQIVTVLTLLCATYAHAEVVAGRDYKLLNPPQPTSSGKKVEVLEFFFYGCPHCYHLHPLISAWEKKMPKDVDFQYVPTIFNEGWEPMAHTYYALEAMGKIRQLHDALFQAWNENVDLSDEAHISEFVGKHGVDRNRFDADYNSFTVSSKIARSNQLVQSFNIRGTPTIAVDGKYIISGLQPEETIRVLDEVIKIARKERNRH